MENPELVRAGTEQLHDNDGAVGSYGVSYDGLQLQVLHQLKSIDSVLACLPDDSTMTS